MNRVSNSFLKVRILLGCYWACWWSYSRASWSYYQGARDSYSRTYTHYSSWQDCPEQFRDCWECRYPTHNHQTTTTNCGTIHSITLMLIHWFLYWELFILRDVVYYYFLSSCYDHFMHAYISLLYFLFYSLDSLSHLLFLCSIAYVSTLVTVLVLARVDLPLASLGSTIRTHTPVFLSGNHASTYSASR